MSNSYFEIIRSGVNTTIQDRGRNHMYYVGITVSGAIDQRNYKLSNKLVGNNLDEAVIEFAYQGPLLKLKNGKINLSVTGDVLFKIIRKNSNIENGVCYKNYILEDEDQIDLISTKNTAYGYLSISGGLELEKTWNSYSINTKANVGPNNGKKYSIKDKIFIKNSDFKKTGQIIFGGYGPTAQHSYFQLLHQGTQDICADIIASKEDLKSLAYAQAITQAKILSDGADDLLKAQEKINGNIPLNLFLLNKIDAYTLGYLIATWEHRTYITAAMLQINPYDQYGVSAGKIYTKKYLQDNGA